MKTVRIIYIISLFAMCFVMLPNFGAQADIINEVTFADVIVDEKEMLGKTVMIPGVMINLGDTNFLYEYAGTMTALTIVTKNLSKEQKKWLLKNVAVVVM